MTTAATRPSSPHVARMLERDRSKDLLGIEVIEQWPGHAVATMTVRPDMVNGFGIAQGGMIFTLADTAFAAACNEGPNLTVAAGAEIVFCRPGRLGAKLVATADRRSLAGRNGVYDVTVRDDEDRVVAEFRGRSRATTTPH